jgi:hypothetical protein
MEYLQAVPHPAPWMEVIACGNADPVADNKPRTPLPEQAGRDLLRMTESRH